MAAKELGHRVHDDVGAVLDRVDQIGRGERAINHQRDSMGMGDICNERHVEYFEPRITGDFGKDQSCVWRDGGGESFRIARVHEGRGDAKAGERHVQHVVASAIDVPARHDVTSAVHQGRDCHEQCRLAAGSTYRSSSVLERCEPLFEHSHRGVRYSAVQVTGLFQIE